MGACASTNPAAPYADNSEQPAPISAPIAAPTATATSHPLLSVMLLALNRDADAQAHLLTFLELHSFARLHATCKQWSQWIEQPSAASRRRVHRSLDYWPSQLHRVASCRWLLATVTEMRDVSDPPVFGRILAAGSNAGPVSSWKRYTDALALLARCPQLHSWTTRFHYEYIPAYAELWPCVAPVAQNLRSLTLQPYGPDRANSLNEWCSMLPGFPQLETLIIHGGNECNRVQLSPIVVLWRLSRFALLSENDSSDFLCSRLMAGCLATCRSLTDVDCGSWMRLEDDDDALGGLRTFVDSRVDPAPASDAAAPLLTPLATLTRLQLQSTVMTAGVLDQLVRLPGLTDLSPLYWSPTITAESIARLASLPRLRSCVIRSPEGQSPFEAGSMVLDIERFLPTLLMCHNLTSLTLDRVRVRKDQIASLYSAYSSMQSLSLPGCRIAGDDGAFALTLGFA